MRKFCLTLLLTLLVSPLALAAPPDHVFTRVDGEVTQVTPPQASAESTTFGLSSDHLAMCSEVDGVRYDLDLTAVGGTDLLENPAENLQSLLGPALFKLNRQMLDTNRGVDLVPSNGLATGRAQQRAERPNRPVAVVGDELKQLRLELFADGGGCQAPAKGSADGPLLALDAAVEECSGSCDCDSCVCVGSEACCDAGCDACWDYREANGLCGPQAV